MKFSTLAVLGFSALANALAISDDFPAFPDASGSEPAPGADPATYRYCREVSFTVNGSALNFNITAAIPLGNVTQLLAAVEAAGTILVSGPQTITGTFCAPNFVNQNIWSLQVFFSSITASRAQFQAMGGVGTTFPEYQPGNYSWTDYANSKGYPTLAIDRLGTGKSSHPDPVLVVQAAYEIELYADLARQLRTGTKSFPLAFKKLIYVGNSYGSQLGAAIAGQHPTAYDTFVLTGFSNGVILDFVGVSLVLPLPAAVVDPARFGTLAPGYVTTSSQVGRTNAFFGSTAQVDFDPVITQLFFQRKDVVSLGQFVSIYAYPFNGKGFKGRVLTLNGDADQAFCGPGSPVIGPANCAPFKAGTASLFPNADFNWHLVPRVGHAQPFFLAHQQIFDSYNAFLNGAEFQT